MVCEMGVFLLCPERFIILTGRVRKKYDIGYDNS